MVQMSHVSKLKKKSKGKDKKKKKRKSKGKRKEEGRWIERENGKKKFFASL